MNTNKFIFRRWASWLSVYVSEEGKRFGLLSGVEDTDPHSEVFDFVLSVGSLQAKQEPFVVEAPVSV